MWGKRFLILTGFLLLIKCSPPPHAYGRGKPREIIIVFDGAVEEAKTLRNYLNEIYYTPHAESLFLIYPMTVEQFKDFKGYRNVILLSHPNSASYSIFREVFGERNPGIYITKDVFMEGDYIVGVLGADGMNLREILLKNLNLVKSKIINRYKRILKTKAYFSGHNKKLMKEVLKDYGFTLDFPKGWAYVTKDRDFVSFARHFPDRFMFIYRERAPRILDSDRLIELRDKLTKIYYNGDFVLKSSVVVKRIEFHGLPAIKVIGAWQNDKEIMGGPFEFIAFNMRNRFYMLDMGVFAPHLRNKIEYIIRMETIMDTFQVEE